MKKHRKLVALLVALTFLFSVVAPAMAAEPSAEQKSADKLNVLGIIEGYPDGSFGLDKNITRAEFAKVAVIAAGFGDAEPLLKNTPSRFSDVPIEWFTGWINLAESQGLVKGDPAGTFRPNDDISYAEVVTVLMRLLGYNENLPGEWPTQFLAKAVQLDITKGVALDAGASATRGAVFMMLDKTLDTPMVEWSNDKQAFAEKEDSDGNKVKLIAQSFDGAMKEGLVVDLEWDRNGDMVVTVAGTGKDNMNVLSRYDVLDNTIVTGADDVFGLFGINVEYVVNEDDELVYVAAKNTNVASDDEVEVIGESRVVVDKKTYTQAEGFGWTGFPGEVDLNDDNELVGDKVVVVLNSRGEAQWAFVYNYEDIGADIIEDIDGNKVFGFDGTRFEYDAKDVQVFIKDGAIADFDALAEGDLIYKAEDAKNADLLVIAVSEVLEGELEEAKTDKTEVTIDGSKIKAEEPVLVSTDAGENFDAELEDVIGETVGYMLSPAGKIAAFISDVKAASKIYGVVEATVYTARGLEARILLGDGTKAVHYVDSDYSGSWINAVGGDDLKQPMGGSVVLVEYSLDKNGRIDYVKSTKPKEGENIYLPFTDYDGNRIELDGKWYRLDANASFFGYEASKEKPDEPGKLIASDWDTFKGVRDKAAPKSVFVLFDNGGRVKALFFDDVITGAGNVGVVAGTGIDRDGTYYRIFVDGDTERYNLAGGAAVGDGVGKGKLVTFNTASGKISSIETVATDVYGTVVSASSDRIEIDGVDRYFYIDAEDTMIVDATGSSPKIVNRVSKFDYVQIYEGEDNKGVVEIILIVKDPNADSGSSGSAGDPGKTYTFNGVYELDGNTYIQLGNQSYPYVGKDKDISELSGATKVKATFTTIRGETVVTSVKAVD